MKILEFKKLFWFIVSLVFIGLAALSLFLNKLSYNRYLEMREGYVEVDCMVIRVDDFERTITVAYVNPEDGIKYYVTFQTIEYEEMDTFKGIIKPEEPTKLKFDNGYSFWNTYAYFATILVIFAVIIDLIIVKRLLVRAIAYNGDKYTCKVTSIKTWKNMHVLVVTHNGKNYTSEVFRTFQNISLLDEGREVDFYKNGFIYHIDLASYHKNYQK